MKHLHFACTVMLLIVTIQSTHAQNAKQVSNTAGKSMRGTYLMQKQTIDSGQGTQPIANQQWKIFTDKYVMYAHRRSESDSSAGFGIGTYQVENGKVIENMFYGDSGPVNGRYELAINSQPDGYTQIIDFPGDNKHYILTETYKRSTRNISSPLDGAWNMEKRIFIDKDGKSITEQSSENAKQFKIYDSGHFMWASSYKDSATGKWNSYFGYGTFEKDSPTQITETNANSSFVHALVDKPVKVKFKMTGKNTYEQVIEGTDGTKQIEYYKRMQ